jgi:putative Mg2+ transporter-C (MgtC) family protein
VNEIEMGLRLALALIVGAVIGLERERRGRPAGLRTFILVALGSSLFMLVSIYVASLNGRGDPARIAAQVVTGIGFLGGGLLLRTGDTVRGLTTAAGIWAVAALGLAAGAGMYTVTVVGTALVLIVLAVLRPVEAKYFGTKEDSSR